MPSDPISDMCDRAGLLLRQGRAADAESLCLQGIQQAPNHAGLLNVLGQCLLSQGRQREAIIALSKAISTSPDRPDLYFNIGIAFQADQRLDEAVLSLKQAVSKGPNVPQLHVKLGQLLLLQGRREEGVSALQRGLELDPNSTAALLNLSSALQECGKLGEAEEKILAALKLSPNDAIGHQALGRLYQLQGKFELATEAFRKVIALSPQMVAPYFTLVYSRRTTEADRPLMKRMEQLLRSAHLKDYDRELLHYALGKCFDDLKSYERAIQHYDQANQIALDVRQSSGMAFNEGLYRSNIDRIVRASQALSAQGGSTSERPIFIVGMIRSGTTLLEQILGAHRDITPGGELDYWTGSVSRALAAVEDGPLSEGWLDQQVSAYDQLLERISVSSMRVTDKMPTNYQVLGIILKAYPKARILHCRRNPIDNCLSVYVTPYHGAPEFGHNRESIVFAYKEYLRLMEAWREQYPEARILDVDYETLTQDPEPTTRRMIEFLGLEWDDRCLKPNESTQSVSTPSQWQVRQPIYRASVERWRNYEPWLGAIGDAFKGPILVEANPGTRNPGP